MDDTKLSLIDHLEEMRVRIMWSLICVAVLFPIGYTFSQPAIEWLKFQFCPPELGALTFIDPMELFFTRLKVGAVLAIFAAFPFLAYHFWRFVAPGLYDHERKYISRYVFVSTALFLIGAGFALFAIFPAVINFVTGMASESIRAELRVAKFVNLAGMLMLAFGIMFQLPIFVYVLAITGLIEVQTMRKCRPIVVAVVFVAAAILTPPDVISQVSLGIPSLILFEISLWIAGISVEKKRKRKEEEEAAEREREEAERARMAAERAAERERRVAAGEDPDAVDADMDGAAQVAPETETQPVAATETSELEGYDEHSGYYEWEDDYYDDDDYYWDEYGQRRRKKKKKRPKRTIKPIGRTGRRGLRRIGSEPPPRKTPPGRGGRPGGRKA